MMLKCPHCGMKVLVPKGDTCPSCRRVISDSAIPDRPDNAESRLQKQNAAVASGESLGNSTPNAEASVRGWGWLLFAVVLVIGSICGGWLIQSEAASTITGSRGIGESIKKMRSLSNAATLVNIGFIVGIIVGIIGIVLIIVDSSQNSSPRPVSSDQSSTEEENRRLREEIAQEENRRLRAEVERLRREREQS